MADTIVTTTVNKSTRRFGASKFKPKPKPPPTKKAPKEPQASDETQKATVEKNTRTDKDGVASVQDDIRTPATTPVPLERTSNGLETDDTVQETIEKTSVQTAEKTTTETLDVGVQEKPKEVSATTTQIETTAQNADITPIDEQEAASTLISLSSIGGPEQAQEPTPSTTPVPTAESATTQTQPEPLSHENTQTQSEAIVVSHPHAHQSEEEDFVVPASVLVPPRGGLISSRSGNIISTRPQIGSTIAPRAPSTAQVQPTVNVASESSSSEEEEDEENLTPELKIARMSLSALITSWTSGQLSESEQKRREERRANMKKRKRSDGDTASIASGASRSTMMKMSENGDREGAIAIGGQGGVEVQKDPNAMLEDQPRPQLRMVNGRMVLDTTSLTMTREAEVDDTSNDFIVNDDTYSNSSTGLKRDKSMKWNKTETKLFYEGIRTCGTDFGAIQRIYFPYRTRGMIKRKFTKEEKERPKLLERALISRKPLSKEKLELVKREIVKVSGDDDDDAEQDRGEDMDVSAESR